MGEEAINSRGYFDGCFKLFQSVLTSNLNLPAQGRSEKARKIKRSSPQLIGNLEQYDGCETKIESFELIKSSKNEMYLPR